MRRLDSRNMLGSLEQLAEQVTEVRRAVEALALPEKYKQASAILVCGMGGSTLGAHILKTVFAEQLSIPFEIVNNYHIPAWVGKNTLVLVASYSGTTEESLSAFSEATARGSLAAVITSGGALRVEAQKNNLPAIVFTTDHNPCGSPRMGLGYSLIGPLLFFAKCGFIPFDFSELGRVVATIEEFGEKFGVAASTETNTAKQFAAALLGKTVWYIGAEHLTGSVHAAANQMNENAKRFAGWFVIPELNHHLLEGMIFPKANPENMAWVLVESDRYDEKIQKRFSVTKEILAKNNIPFVVYSCAAPTKFLQAMECLVLSSYTSYYSALLEGLDPTAIPFVDYFKAALQK